MTIETLVSWLLSKALTAERVKRAKRHAEASALAWADVLAAMTEEQRQQVTDAH